MAGGKARPLAIPEAAAFASRTLRLFAFVLAMLPLRKSARPLKGAKKQQGARNKLNPRFAADNFVR
jgi:hypothetical protein